MMLPFLLSLFLIHPVTAQPTEEIPVAIYVSGLESDDGQLILEIYSSEASFKKREGAVKRVRIRPEGLKANCEVMLPPGGYAFYIHHDENGNGKMDRYFFGMPKEGIAASNNAQGFMGPPDYADAVFRVASPRVNMKVTMNYL